MSISETLIKSPHRGKWNGKGLILGKNRVKNFGEVLTPPNIVSDMLDLVGKEYKCQLGQENGDFPIDKTFLEPACGTGNFLVQILGRKLRNCVTDEDIFTAVASIYGIDIQADNVLESRLRMLEIVEKVRPDEEFLKVIADVLEKNIMGGDFLKDKRGCQDGNAFIKGYVSNKTGLVEDDSNLNASLIAYTWKWGSPVECTVERLHEDEKPTPIVQVAKESFKDYQSQFGSMKFKYK